MPTNNPSEFAEELRAFAAEIAPFLCSPATYTEEFRLDGRIDLLGLTVERGAAKFLFYSDTVGDYIPLEEASERVQFEAMTILPRLCQKAIEAKKASNQSQKAKLAALRSIRETTRRELDNLDRPSVIPEGGLPERPREEERNRLEDLGTRSLRGLRETEKDCYQAAEQARDTVARDKYESTHPSEGVALRQQCQRYELRIANMETYIQEALQERDRAVRDNERLHAEAETVSDLRAEASELRTALNDLRDKVSDIFIGCGGDPHRPDPAGLQVLYEAYRDFPEDLNISSTQEADEDFVGMYP